MSSFLAGINPFYREGVKPKELDAEVLSDPTQRPHRVSSRWGGFDAYVILLDDCRRRALGPAFMTMLAKKCLAANAPPSIKTSLGGGVRATTLSSLRTTGKPSALTKSAPRPTPRRDHIYNRGSGLPKGAIRYQILVPSYGHVLLFLGAHVGWLFASDAARARSNAPRRLLTKANLVAAARLCASGHSGRVLVAGGQVVFGMRWGPDSRPIGADPVLSPAIASTSLAAMARLLIASVARTSSSCDYRHTSGPDFGGHERRRCPAT